MFEKLVAIVNPPDITSFAPFGYACCCLLVVLFFFGIGCFVRRLFVRW